MLPIFTVEFCDSKKEIIATVSTFGYKDLVKVRETTYYRIMIPVNDVKFQGKEVSTYNLNCQYRMKKAFKDIFTTR